MCAAPQGLRGAFLEPVLAPDTLVDGPRGKVTILEPFASFRSPGTRRCPPLIPKPRSQQIPILISQFWEVGAALPEFCSPGARRSPPLITQRQR